MKERWFHTENVILHKEQMKFEDMMKKDRKDRKLHAQIVHMILLQK